jgi:predicted RND superfamily exporter protein
MQKNKYYSLLIIILLIINFKALGQEEFYTNTTILFMLKQGLSQSIIKNKIQQKKCEFNISIDSLIYLKKNSVRDHLIIDMIEKMNTQYTHNRYLRDSLQYLKSR